MAFVSIHFTAKGGQHRLSTEIPDGASARDKVCEIFNLLPSEVTITSVTTN